MILNKKIGCGIITCNRPEGLIRLYKSLPMKLLDEVIIINNGDNHQSFDQITDIPIIHHPKNIGVGRSKNEALRWMLDRGVDHFFLIEDDVYIRQPFVFEQYILTSQLTGIQHLNYSQHGPANKDYDQQPKPRLNVEYNGLSIPFYPNCVGAFCYFS